jgi:hypothetical protein
MGRWLKSNQGIGVGLTFFFTALLLYTQLTPWAHTKLRDGFTLGFFPAVSIFLLIIVSLVLCFDSRRKQVPDRLKNLTLKYFLSTVLAVFYCWVYFKSMTAVGFLVTTPPFLLCSMYILGLKSWRTLVAASIFITVIVYAIFSIMGIELPPVTLPRI